MTPLIEEVDCSVTPELLMDRLRDEKGLVCLRSNYFDSPQSRYSFVCARPFLTFRSSGSRCAVTLDGAESVHFGNPWRVLDVLLARYELLDELDLPFPIGGCFGFWGYDLKNFSEPGLPSRAIVDQEIPDCHVGFYDSLVVFDHRLGRIWIVNSGLHPDGSRSRDQAIESLERWKSILGTCENCDAVSEGSSGPKRTQKAAAPVSTLSRDIFIERVQRAQAYIREGHIYQVNLSHRLTEELPTDAPDFFRALACVSPAPFSAYVDGGDFQIASSSPEQFLRMSGQTISSRPIKGTRPRHSDVNQDARLSYELQTSAKEAAELVMITDLMRNDIGRISEYGSVQVKELLRLEKYPQVQHLVSMIEGRLIDGTTHLEALSRCFPGGSITGAPKIRAMEIIDELEPVARGPYTGCLGYLGFNRESQLSILIRTALIKDGQVHFNVGAGIVADSVPEQEYQETFDKAAGFHAALRFARSSRAGRSSSDPGR